jgi:hypothetical protein
MKTRLSVLLGCLILFLGCDTAQCNYTSRQTDTGTSSKEKELPPVTSLLDKNVQSAEVQLFCNTFELQHRQTVTTQIDTRSVTRKLTRIENHFSSADYTVRLVSCKSAVNFRKEEVVASIQFTLPVSTVKLAVAGLKLPYDLSSDATPRQALAGWGNPDLDRVNHQGDGCLVFSFRGEDCICTKLEYRSNKLIAIEFYQPCN